jgi:hypothetical protein
VNNTTGRSLPPFQAVTPAESTLTVRWAPLAEGERASVVIALRAIGPELAADFWGGSLDNDLIRQPVKTDSTQTTLYVPVGRPVLLALIVRGADGEIVNGRPVHIQSPGAQSWTQGLESPVEHHAQDGHDAPLIFAHDSRPAGFEQLARQLASNTGAAHREPLTTAPLAAFGARQRWTLTRLTWPDQGGAPLALVIREQFVDATAIASWRTTLPVDAHHVAPSSDGFIDAQCPLDALQFYVLLSGPAPWKPVALSPVSPPFEATQRPHVIGDLGARLTEGVDTIVRRLEQEALALSDVDPQLALLKGAVALLPPHHGLRLRVDKIAQRWAPGRRL